MAALEDRLYEEKTDEENDAHREARAMMRGRPDLRRRVGRRVAAASQRHAEQ